MEEEGVHSESNEEMDDSGDHDEASNLDSDHLRDPDREDIPLRTDGASASQHLLHVNCSSPSVSMHDSDGEQSSDEAMSSPDHLGQQPDQPFQQPNQSTSVQHPAQVCSQLLTIPSGDNSHLMAVDGGLNAASIEGISHSSRCDPPQIPAATPLFATGQCTQSARGNASNNQNAAELQNQQAQGPAPAARAPPSSPFAWSKVQSMSGTSRKKAVSVQDPHIHCGRELPQPQARYAGS